jgi:hypothetical protein
MVIFFFKFKFWQIILKSKRIFNRNVFFKNILPNGKNWPKKKMFGDIRIYLVYIKRLSQRGEYNKFKIPTLVWQLGAQKNLNMNNTTFHICLHVAKIYHKKKHWSQ